MTGRDCIIALPLTVRRYGPNLYDLIDANGEQIGSIYDKAQAELIAGTMNELEGDKT